MSKEPEVHWRSLIDSEVIRYVDIGEQEFTLEITAVKKGKITGKNGKTSGKALISFKGAEKPLGAGAAILSVIAQLYGPNVKKWIGRSVTLYGDPSVTFGGERVGGIRVRPVVPKVEQAKKDGAA
jgi:hypothetical protein